MAVKPAQIKTKEQLIETIKQLWEARSIRELRGWLVEMETEEEFYRLLRLADNADLYAYSNFLSTQAYKRFGTLRTFAWHCTRLLETGRSLEAEERMHARLRQPGAQHSVEGLAAAHVLLLKVYCQLNRLTEAEEQLNAFRKLKGSVPPDIEAFYLVSRGQRAEAEALLASAVEQGDTDRLDFAQLYLADVLVMDGRQEESLAELLAGEARSGYGTFRTEQVKRLFYLGRYREAIALAKELNTCNPFHAYRRMFVHLIADAYYRLADWDGLASWINNHPEELKETVFGKADIDQHANWRLLELRPRVQKLNYCVPASLSLMLQAYGRETGQDEIAEHVFDVTGSKLQTTMAYMESLGMAARYFKGTVDTYKSFLDAGVPVLLSMLIENSAHVQVVVGYDDRLQALFIQDPNDIGPVLLPYREVAETYKMSDTLSMVFLDEGRKGLLNLIDGDQHRFFTGMFAYLEESEGKEEDAGFTDFLLKHKNERYAAVIGLFSLYTESAKKMHETWLRQLESEFGEDDKDLALLAAHMHYHRDEHGEVLRRLEGMAVKTPYALFLKAVSLLNEEKTRQAIPLLKQSIEFDHYQPIAYSYLARAYLEAGKESQAFKWSSVAIGQLPSDVFVQVTHAMIQFESGAAADALERYRELSKEDPEDPYFHYEMGRCLDMLGQEEEASAAYLRTIALDPGKPYARLRMADRAMEAERWDEAETVIREGLEVSEQADILYTYLGHIGIGRGRPEEAETGYRLGLEKDPSDLYLVTHIAHALIKQGKLAEAAEWIGTHKESGDLAFFIRTASMLWEEGEGEAAKEIALGLLEELLAKPSGEGFLDACECYAAFGEDNRFRARIMTRFRTIRQTAPAAEVLVLEGELYEQEQNPGFAKELYRQAIEMHETPGAWLRLGSIAAAEENHYEAAGCFGRCTELDPGNAEAFAGLFGAYEQLGNHGAAFEAGLHLLELEPTAVQLDELFTEAMDETALAAVENRIEQAAGRVPAEWLYAARARAAEQRGDFQGVERLYERAAREKGAFPSRYQFVRYLHRRGEHQRALNLLETLIAEEPGEQDLYSEFMTILLEAKKIKDVHKRLKKMLGGEQLGMAQLFCADAWVQMREESEPVPEKSLFGKIRSGSSLFFSNANIILLYEEAKKNMPDSEWPRIRLADFYMNQELIKDAMKELAPFIERTGNEEAARMLLQIKLFHAGATGSQAIYEEAAELAEGLLARQRGDVQLLLMHGDAMAALEQVEEAAAQYGKAAALSPYTEDAYVRLLQLAEPLPDKARQTAKALPAEIRQLPLVRLSCGMMHTALGEGAVARELLSALAQDEPGYAPVYYEWARAEMVFGNRLAGRELLEKLETFDEGPGLLEMAAADPLLEAIQREPV